MAAYKAKKKSGRSLQPQSQMSVFCLTVLVQCKLQKKTEFAIQCGSPFAGITLLALHPTTDKIGQGRAGTTTCYITHIQLQCWQQHLLLKLKKKTPN